MGKVFIPEVLPPEPPAERALVPRKRKPRKGLFSNDAEEVIHKYNAARAQRQEALEQIQFATAVLEKFINLLSQPERKSRRGAKSKKGKR